MKLEPDDLSEDGDDEADEAISLEELSQTYVNLVSKNSSAAKDKVEPQETPERSSGLGVISTDGERLEVSPEAETAALSDEDPANAAVTPRSILEAILFVGRPDSRGITATEIAGLMRGVQTHEIEALVAELNESYGRQQRALQIVDGPDGYRLSLAPQAEEVRDRFYGRVRPVNLSQAAIDCLALIAYQPGISRAELDRQRGQSSGGVLNQLVRRQLIELRRETVEGNSVTQYYPTERLAQLAGLATLEDLPQVEEFDP